MLIRYAITLKTFVSSKIPINTFPIVTIKFRRPNWNFNWGILTTHTHTNIHRYWQKFAHIHCEYQEELPHINTANENQKLKFFYCKLLIHKFEIEHRNLQINFGLKGKSFEFLSWSNCTFNYETEALAQTMQFSFDLAMNEKGKRNI